MPIARGSPPRGCANAPVWAPWLVNAASGFSDHPKVVNGASDLMVEVLGDAGRHTRSALGCSGLPANAATEIDAILLVAL